MSYWPEMWFGATSAVKILTFTYIKVSVYLVFIQTQFMLDKRALGLLKEHCGLGSVSLQAA